jgi:hypothetical protein
LGACKMVVIREEITLVRYLLNEFACRMVVIREEIKLVRYLNYLVMDVKLW